jgi:hypothetical protein
MWTPVVPLDLAEAFAPSLVLSRVVVGRLPRLRPDTPPLLQARAQSRFLQSQHRNLRPLRIQVL